MNTIIIIGRLTDDPVLRRTQSDIAVANFTVAVNRMGSEDADFIKCVAWKKQAENVAKFLSKGSMVGIEGNLRISSYDDNQGTRRQKAEVNAYRVEFLDTKKKEEKEETPSKKPEDFEKQDNSKKPEDFGDLGDEVTDDLPF